MEKLLKRVYVWELPVRLTHWINVLAIVTMALTGYYIANPFIQAVSADQFIMGWVRFIHFVAAYTFIVSLAIRLYWSFMGNDYASWKAFFPVTGNQPAKLIQQMLYYSFLGKKPRFAVGHTPLAGLTYLIIFALYLMQILTGFALYSLSNPKGFYSTTFGWVLMIISEPTARMIHHIIMWLLIYFVFIHVYFAFYLDRAERSGLVSSIFTGTKLVYPEVKVKD